MTTGATCLARGWVKAAAAVAVRPIAPRVEPTKPFGAAEGDAEGSDGFGIGIEFSGEPTKFDAGGFEATLGSDIGFGGIISGEEF